MKKTAMVLSLILVLSLVACGSKKEAVPENLSLEEIYQNIMDAQTGEAPVMFPESSVEIIENYYPGLFDAGVEEEALYMPPVTGAPCEIMLVKAKSEDDVQGIKDILQERIDIGKEDTFYPENAAGWQNAVVQSAGKYVAMIVLQEGGVIPENVFVKE